MCLVWQALPVSLTPLRIRRTDTAGEEEVDQMRQKKQKKHRRGILGGRDSADHQSYPSMAC